MPTEFVQKSPADVINDLSKIAAEKGDDFTLKLSRRGSPGSITPQHVGIFVHATVEHIRNAEAWVAPFSGGGLYTLNVYKDNEPSAVLPLSEIMGPPRHPTPSATKQPTWLGPEYLFPSPEEARASAPAVGDRGLGGLTAPSEGAPEGIPGLLKDLQRREEAMAARERKLELETLRREQAEHTARLEARIAELARAADRPAAPAVPAFDLEKIGGLVMAGLKMWSDSANASRLEEKKLEEERRRQENEHRKEEADRRAASEARYMEMMKAATTRADEQMKHFSGLLEAQSKMSHSSMELQSSIQRNVLQAVADVAQLQLRSGDKDEGIDWGKVVREAIAALASAGKPSAPGAPGMMTPGLPAASNAPGAAAPGQAFAGAPSIEKEIPEAEALNEVEDRIRQHGPPEQIAAAIIEAMKTPEAQEELKAFGGDFMALFQDRMQDFIDEKGAKGEQKNAAYLNSIFEELQRQSGQGGASA